MSNCDQVKLLIEAYFTGEISLSNFKILQQHVGSCEFCRALLEIHFDTTSDDQSIPMPTDFQLEEMRSRVLEQIAKETEKPASNVYPFPQYLKFWNHGLGIAAMLLIAVWVGRWSANIEPGLEAIQTVATNSSGDRELLDQQSFIEQLTHQASNQSPHGNIQDDFWDSPIFYSNVSFGRYADQKINLGFDVCRRIDMKAAPDSHIAKEVMLHAILNPTTSGGQFKAMQVAAITQDERLLEALILTMHNDEELAVRIEAFSILAKLPQSDVIENGFLQTIREDKSIKMRLVALKQLSKSNQFSPETLLENIHSGRNENSAALIQALGPIPKTVYQQLDET
jgi:hypothetical protein